MTASGFTAGTRIVTAQGRTGVVIGRGSASARYGLCMRVKFDTGQTYDVPVSSLSVSGLPRYIVTTGTGAAHLPFGVYDRNRSRFVDSFATRAAATDRAVDLNSGRPCPDGVAAAAAVGSFLVAAANAPELGKIGAGSFPVTRELAAGALTIGTFVIAADQVPAVATWARDFASDCEWQDVDADDIADMTDAAVIRNAARQYDGGIRALVRDALADDDTAGHVAAVEHADIIDRAADPAPPVTVDEIVARFRFEQKHAGTRERRHERMRLYGATAADAAIDALHNAIGGQ
jgi:hypothetical protein